ncbi:MAG: SMP-30/gluconolactonase/LRE family protein [Metallosphaera yellowstonensis]|jgi:Gluconolactonase
MKVEVFLKSDAILGEGPLWDWRDNTLYWVDILKGELHTVKGSSHVTYPSPKMISALGLREDGGLVVSAYHDLYVWKNGRFSPLSALDTSEEVRFNDGKCSPWGDFWVGTMDLRETREIGSMYRFREGRFSLLHDGLIISNGLDWLGDTFFLVDSPKKSIFAFKWNGERLEPQGVAVKTSYLPGVPDGMTLDSTGLMWVAHYGGGVISVWEPFAEKPVQVIRLPVKIVTSLTFGGIDLREVFVTTSRREGEELGGSVLRFEAENKGRPALVCNKV